MDLIHLELNATLAFKNMFQILPNKIMRIPIGTADRLSTDASISTALAETLKYLETSSLTTANAFDVYALTKVDEISMERSTQRIQYTLYFPIIRIS